jgi:hypothetical protein
VQHNQLEENVKDTKNTGISGAIALLIGVVIGAFGFWSASKTVNSVPDVPETNPLDTLDLTEDEKGEADSTFEDVTPDTSTLMDSLEGISVDGPDADLVKVRVLGVERAKHVAMWGTKGLNGDQPTKFQRLVDLTTEHLLNIKKNSPKVSPDERRIIDSILEDRVAAGEADAAVLSI